MMREIFRKEYKTFINVPFSEHIAIQDSGLYVFEICASAQSWWQNTRSGRSFLKKDSLTARINDVSLGGTDKGRRLRADDFWNGNILKGHDCAVSIVSFLEKGSASYSFDVVGKPYLESVAIFALHDSSITLKDVRPQKRDRAPSLTFFCHAGCFFSSLMVRARAGKKRGDRDDDDVQVRIDGKIERNQNKKAHKDWYWCGKVLQGEEYTCERTFVPQAMPHRIEFWTDETPAISQMIIHVKKQEDRESKNRIMALVTWEKAVMRKEPRKGSTIIQEVSKGDEMIILKRAVPGDRPSNAQGQILFSDRWHKVSFDDIEGYIYSEALEIGGEDEESIGKLIIRRAKKLEQDPCLMLAIAKTESHLFVYRVSEDNAQGLFQLRPIAIKQVNESFKKSISNPFDIEQNIEAGMLYFTYLVNHYKNTDHQIERALAAWNWGMNNVPKERTYSRKDLADEPRIFIERVLSEQKKCTSHTQAPLMYGIIGAVVVSLFLIVGITALSSSESQEPSHIISRLYGEEGGYSVVEERILDFDHDGRKERFLMVETKHGYPGYAILMRHSKGRLIPIPEIDEGIISWSVGDVNENGKPDVLIHFGYSGSGGFGTVVIYEWFESTFNRVFYRTAPSGTFVLKNMDGYSDHELVFFYKKSKWGMSEQMEIYKWDQQHDTYILLKERECGGMNCLDIDYH